MIVVGMSGGVDSAVTALLLKQSGEDVLGVFMKNWEEDDENGVCAATRDYDDVRRTCDAIGIRYYTVNFAKEYMERVFAHCLREYKAGRTPNPDVLCNREIKFDAFLKFAQSVGAQRIATGHFVRRDDAGNLLKGCDANKDQSYFLYMLKAEQLKRAVFPVGGMTKQQVRETARRFGLPVSEKKDSTGICFIGERRFKPFLQKYFRAEKGDIVTPDGTRVGTHDGLMFYTIGQRRGLGIGGNGDGDGRWFVVEKDMRNNRLVVERNENSRLLFSSESVLTDVTWIADDAPARAFTCGAKFRYRQPDQAVDVEITDAGAVVRAREPQRAVTPGQSVVFYDGEICLGGGIVT